MSPSGSGSCRTARWLRPVWDDANGLVCKPEAARGIWRTAAASGTVRLPCVNFEVLSPTSVWPFRSIGGKGTKEVLLAPRLSVNTAEAAVSAATEGVGVTRVLHYQCADAVRKGSLRIVLEGFEVEPMPVHLLHAGGPLASKVRVFLDFAREHLKQRLTSF